MEEGGFPRPPPPLSGDTPTKVVDENRISAERKKRNKKKNSSTF